MTRRLIVKALRQLPRPSTVKLLVKVQPKRELTDVEAKPSTSTIPQVIIEMINTKVTGEVLLSLMVADENMAHGDSPRCPSYDSWAIKYH